ncbi:universal stress protein [Mycobacterium sp. IDR2000157661]|uniref:universal stress protein n=1 Tax=Mycobacterium sp. IDR2000157661 TaxID=2867005 RepID=UPI001EEB3D02|nr:universal stress protein [Mycobacterium sp. IDR2000157661]ULE33525.1 universal stress protein [Mycobacterium sp. IDR2000157661]
MDTTLVIALAVAWGVIGLLSGLWMARRGYDPLWILIALPLGPLFLPIAIERVQRRPGAAGPGEAIPPHRSSADSRPRVLVGLDGSQESKRVLATVLRMFGPHCGLLVIAEVLHYEAADDVTGADVDAAKQRLATMAAQADCVGAVHTEVLAGAPSVALRQYAEQNDIDLLVVGRRGRGLSARVLGSVSADLVEHSAVPVLVIEPAQKAAARTNTEALRMR